MLSSCGSPTSSAASSPGVGTTVSGTLRSPGGPYLFDRYGRVVFLHGVNAVYKYPPFELYPDPGHPWSFTAADAREIAQLGFNVVRLGILWQGLEPGEGGPNQPSICRRGKPKGTAELRQEVLQGYLDKVVRTVDLLGRYHVYTLLDMHQDVYNQVFRGEGAPAWAVCTDGVPPTAVTGRWSRNYGNPLLQLAMSHFWYNDVVGNLQGQYDAVWAAVAHRFRDNPWVVGYDPFNEPLSLDVLHHRRRTYAIDLQCFYTGTLHPARFSADGASFTCPPDDPRLGVVPSIEKADPNHLVFVEPDNFSVHDRPGQLGPMPFPRLVLNFHSYCRERNPVTGEPTSTGLCVEQEDHVIMRHSHERAAMSTRYQPGGPGWFMSEFGANQDVGLLDRLTDTADLMDLGWSYWSWKYYDDPTGSAAEPLVTPSGAPGPDKVALSRTYVQAVAGTPVTVSYEPPTGNFRLTYVVNHQIVVPTVLYLAPQTGARTCIDVSGARWRRSSDGRHLYLWAQSGAQQVSVEILRGSCSDPDP